MEVTQILRYISDHAWQGIGIAFFCGVMISYTISARQRSKFIQNNVEMAKNHVDEVNEKIKELEFQMEQQWQHMYHTLAETDAAVTHVLKTNQDAIEAAGRKKSPNKPTTPDFNL